MTDGSEDAELSEPIPIAEGTFAPAEIRALLQDWLVRAMAAQYGHQTKADRNRQLGVGLGIPTVIISTIVGTAAFAAINDQSTNAAKIAVGILSVGAAVLASVQTYLGYSQLAEKHRVSAVRYAAVRRDIQIALASNASAGQIEEIRREMGKTGALGPQIGSRIWESSLKGARAELRDAARGSRPAAPAPAPSAPTTTPPVVNLVEGQEVGSTEGSSSTARTDPPG